MNEFIYLASPYAHPNKNVTHKRMEVLYDVMGDFISKGVHVVSPLFMHEIVVRHDLKDDYDFWEHYCLNMLKRCDKMIVLTMDGWDKSRGVAEEIAFCEKNNIPVEYFNIWYRRWCYTG